MPRALSNDISRKRSPRAFSTRSSTPAELPGRTLGRDELLLVQPGGELPAITGGSGGAQLLELARTARGALPHLLSDA